MVVTHDVPRERGDEPAIFVLDCHPNWHLMFPASAGMNRRIRQRNAACDPLPMFPASAGDEPARDMSSDLKLGIGMFPASAGMNRLKHGEVADEPSYVPRERGDEPFCQPAADWARGFICSPRARG